MQGTSSLDGGVSSQTEKQGHARMTLENVMGDERAQWWFFAISLTVSAMDHFFIFRFVKSCRIMIERQVEREQ